MNKALIVFAVMVLWRITVEFNTNGYGGRKVRERVYSETNDSQRPRLSVSVTGIVEKFAKIRPEHPVLVPL